MTPERFALLQAQRAAAAERPARVAEFARHLAREVLTWDELARVVRLGKPRGVPTDYGLSTHRARFIEAIGTAKLEAPADSLAFFQAVDAVHREVYLGR